MTSEATIVIMQPGYLPWIGFFELLHRATTFIVYDTVQCTKNDWRNRNRIKTPQGPLWLSVPIHLSGLPLIKDVRIDNSSNWRKKHLEAIRTSYSRSRYFADYFPVFQGILSQRWEFLTDLDCVLIEALAAALGISTVVRRASAIDVPTSEDRVERLVLICKRFGATTFYEPAGGRGYLEPRAGDFERAGISLVFQEFRTYPYGQLYGEFIPNLSVVDLLFNEGPRSLTFIQKGGGPHSAEGIT